MKSTFLAKLHTYGGYYLTSALLLLLGVPLYQFLVLTPQGFPNALSQRATGRSSTYLVWISTHGWQFLGYRGLLILAFALLLTLPFTLFRIIVAQEIMREQEMPEVRDVQEEVTGTSPLSSEGVTASGMPAYAWRGKGFAIIAAWAGLGGIVVYLLGTIVSTLYLSIVGQRSTPQSPPPDHFTFLSGLFSLLTNTVGLGLLALATLFFGAMIARSGPNLWPSAWVAFGYMALAVAALLSGSAVAVASAATSQAALTSSATLLFALWVLWFGGMLVRLKPEP